VCRTSRRVGLRSRKHFHPHISAALTVQTIVSYNYSPGEQREEGESSWLSHRCLERQVAVETLRVHAVSNKQQLQRPTTERVLLADLHVELWSLFVTSGKLAGRLVHACNMHPDFERGNCGENYAYYNRIFMLFGVSSLALGVRLGRGGAIPVRPNAGFTFMAWWGRRGHSITHRPPIPRCRYQSSPVPTAAGRSVCVMVELNVSKNSHSGCFPHFCNHFWFWNSTSGQTLKTRNV